jgi:hypothetical protein
MAPGDGGFICLDRLELGLAARAARRLDLPHNQAAPLNPLQSSGMADVRSSAA